MANRTNKQGNDRKVNLEMQAQEISTLQNQVNEIENQLLREELKGKNYKGNLCFEKCTSTIYKKSGQSLSDSTFPKTRIGLL
jgi:23S rRNA maturation mini-RNase III